MSTTQEKSSTAGASVMNEERHDRHQRDTNNNTSLGIETSRVVRYFANCAPCLTSEPPDYSSLPATAPSQYEYGPRPPFYSDNPPPSSQAQSWTLPPNHAGAFAYDENPASQFIPGYPVLQPSQPSQPMTVQPSTRGEGMLYPETPSRPTYLVQPETSQATNHVMSSPHLNYSPTQCEAPGSDLPDYNSGVGYLPRVGHGTQSVGQPSRGLDMVQPQQRPPPAKRGPFKSNDAREKTAETRRIGSCIRCRMQRIRCIMNPDDKYGTCLTCAGADKKIMRMPCLRYKISEVKLFKPGQVKGHEWTKRWAEGIADDISQWASTELRVVCVTEGYTKQPVQLSVRQFIPQSGDALERSWYYNGTKRSVSIPPFAIVDIEDAKKTYLRHIRQGVRECCRCIVSGKEKLIQWTYALALKLMENESTSLKERELLRKTLELWMAVRMSTKSTYIVGEETLDMSFDIMDETSPLRGHIPLPPVMGAQIDLVLIHQIQTKLRREMLDDLQAMTGANNNHSAWLTMYVVLFILLHNVALLCQHDAAYARKHGMKTRFARENMVREYQQGGNILLAHFHYRNKGVHPFSMDCKEQELSNLVNLDAQNTKFIQFTRTVVKEQRKHWEKLRQSNDYENDFYFISQLFEEDWKPSTI